MQINTKVTKESDLIDFISLPDKNANRDKIRGFYNIRLKLRILKPNARLDGQLLFNTGWKLHINIVSFDPASVIMKPEFSQVHLIVIYKYFKFLSLGQVDSQSLKRRTLLPPVALSCMHAISAVPSLLSRKLSGLPSILPSKI